MEIKRKKPIEPNYLGKKRRFADNRNEQKTKRSSFYETKKPKNTRKKVNIQVASTRKKGHKISSSSIKTANSIKDNKMSKGNNAFPYSDFPESTIIKATEEDFNNPLSFFDQLLAKKDSVSGVIKIIPPKGWKKNYEYLFEKFYKKRFLEKDLRFETRCQNLNTLFYGKNFDFSKKFSFAEYKNLSEKLLKHFEKTHKIGLDDVNNLNKTEKLYWELCKSEKQEKVYYAADLPFMKYLTKKDIQDMNNIEQKDHNKSLFTLQNINLLENSLFQFLKEDEKSHISGLTMPWIYFGMIFSTFCWHVEDLFLYSLNYMHYGAPKIWYSLADNEKEKMNNFLRRKYEHIECKNSHLIEKLTLLIDPQELKENGIIVHKTVQNPGEIIITLPNSYHAGFSAGFNISEAVNFATNKWINYGINAANEYIDQNIKSPVFPLEWLIFKNYHFLNKSQFTFESDKMNIVSHYNKIKQDELSKRKITENFYKEMKIKTKILPMNENWDYSLLCCEICKRYAFHSLIECNECFKKCCINHNHPCECSKSNRFCQYNIYYKEFL